MTGTRPRPAVFLDRDGTVNEQMGYINHISRFHLLPHAAGAIKLLNDNSVPVIVVSNQSGLARGYFPLELLDQVNEKMKSLLAREGARIDGLYYCPHHPEAKEEQYRRDCDCRKPKIGMLQQAAKEMNIDLARSFLVGDRWSDVKCAHRAGCTSILVLTGYGQGDYRYIGPGQEIQPAYVAENLLEAVEWILPRIDRN
ncbi:MAG: HAD family hydrolase [Desulfobulbaceae bacterium]|nr:HAD family hydrolase [Desulfobulbaceae bacterium]